jgi:hypothetical protein
MLADDDAELVGEHVRQQRLHGVKRAVDVEREGLLHQRIVDVEKFGAANGRAGRIEQKLDAAESGDGALGQGVDLAALGDVGFDGQRLAALAVDGKRGLAGAFFIDVGADDIGPLRGRRRARWRGRCRCPPR